MAQKDRWLTHSRRPESRLLISKSCNQYQFGTFFFFSVLDECDGKGMFRLSVVNLVSMVNS